MSTFNTCVSIRIYTVRDIMTYTASMLWFPKYNSAFYQEDKHSHWMREQFESSNNHCEFTLSLLLAFVWTLKLGSRTGLSIHGKTTSEVGFHTRQTNGFLSIVLLEIFPQKNNNFVVLMKHWARRYPNVTRALSSETNDDNELWIDEELSKVRSAETPKQKCQIYL